MQVGHREIAERPIELSSLEEGDVFVYIPAKFGNMWEVLKREEDKIEVQLHKEDREIVCKDRPDAQVFIVKGE